MEVNELKNSLLQACEEFISDRKAKVLKALNDIKESLFDESKTTVGDKHHTNRARLQNERESLGAHLLEIERVEARLHKIDFDIASEAVHLGSLVETNLGVYFISISMGAAEIEGKTIYCVAPNSPVGQALLGKKVNETGTFQDKSITIASIK
ncbi:MAG: 3-oxoacyl-ACP synthase [Flavobacteriaceae bacterium]|nr:3-oxoacyl-ACP synthase [Flavobacteriaceae bacterium]